MTCYGCNSKTSCSSITIARYKDLAGGKSENRIEMREYCKACFDKERMNK